MPTEIIDLDAALPPDKRVKLAGKVYSLPGDLPVELFLRIQRASTSLGENGAIEDLHGAVLELFRSRDKTVKELPIGMAQMVTLIVQVYTGEAEPNPPRTRGATGSSRPRSRSRSSR